MAFLCGIERVEKIQTLLPKDGVAASSLLRYFRGRDYAWTIDALAIAATMELFAASIKQRQSDCQPPQACWTWNSPPGGGKYRWSLSFVDNPPEPAGTALIIALARTERQKEEETITIRYRAPILIPKTSSGLNSCVTASHDILVRGTTLALFANSLHPAHIATGASIVQEFKNHLWPTVFLSASR